MIFSAIGVVGGEVVNIGDMEEAVVGREICVGATFAEGEGALRMRNRCLNEVCRDVGAGNASDGALAGVGGRGPTGGGKGDTVSGGIGDAGMESS